MISRQFNEVLKKESIIGSDLFNLEQILNCPPKPLSSELSQLVSIDSARAIGEMHSVYKKIVDKIQKLNPEQNLKLERLVQDMMRLSAFFNGDKGLSRQIETRLEERIQTPTGIQELNLLLKAEPIIVENSGAYIDVLYKRLYHEAERILNKAKGKTYETVELDYGKMFFANNISRSYGDFMINQYVANTINFCTQFDKKCNELLNKTGLYNEATKQTFSSKSLYRKGGDEMVIMLKFPMGCSEQFIENVRQEFKKGLEKTISQTSMYTKSDEDPETLVQEINCSVDVKSAAYKNYLEKMIYIAYILDNFQEPSATELNDYAIKKSVNLAELTQENAERVLQESFNIAKNNQFTSDKVENTKTKIIDKHPYIESVFDLCKQADSALFEAGIFNENEKNYFYESWVKKFDCYFGDANTDAENIDRNFMEILANLGWIHYWAGVEDKVKPYNSEGMEKGNAVLQAVINLMHDYISKSKYKKCMAVRKSGSYITICVNQNVAKLSQTEFDRFRKELFEFTKNTTSVDVTFGGETFNVSLKAGLFNARDPEGKAFDKMSTTTGREWHVQELEKILNLSEGVFKEWLESTQIKKPKIADSFWYYFYNGSRGESYIKQQKRILKKMRDELSLINESRKFRLKNIFQNGMPIGSSLDFFKLRMKILDKKLPNQQLKIDRIDTILQLLTKIEDKNKNVIKSTQAIGSVVRTKDFASHAG